MVLSIKQVVKVGIVTLGAPLVAAAVLTWTSPMASASAEAASVYKARCVSCHGEDGKGSTPVGKSMKLRDLGSAEVQSQSDEDLYSITAKGKGKMPGYEKSLGADACRELVGHIRTLKH